MKCYFILSVCLIAANAFANNGDAVSEHKDIGRVQEAVVTEKTAATRVELEEILLQAELDYGKHAEQLLPILERLILVTQESSVDESEAYNLRRTRIYLRHNSSDFVTQFQDVELPATKHSKDMLKRVSKFFKRDFKLYETPHWSIIYHQSQGKTVVKKVAPHMEKTYDSALSFLIAFGLRNKPLKNKMTAIYFQSKDDYVAFISQTANKKTIERTGGVYSLKLNALAFFDYGEGKLVHSTTVSHEAAHQVMFNAGLQLNNINQSRWLVEGLAATFEPMLRKQEFGPHTNNYSVKRMKQIKKLKSEDAVPSVKDIVSSSYKGESGTDNTSKVYAMGSMLVRYLYRYHPDEFKNYLKILAKSKPTKGRAGRKRMFSKAFGDPELLQASFDEFVNDALIEFKSMRKNIKLEKEAKAG